MSEITTNKPKLSQQQLFEFYISRIHALYNSAQNQDTKFAIMVCWHIMEDMIADIKYTNS